METKDFETMVRDAGLQFWQRPDARPGTYYGYVTDGVRIAYVQKDRNPFSGWSVSSTHMPNRVTGTGYCLFRHLDAVEMKHIENAFEYHAANEKECEATHKWADWNAFLNRDTWNADFVKTV